MSQLLRIYADVAQLAEQLICNQQVIGSSPIIGFMDGFPSGQREQTVNLLLYSFGGSNPPPSICFLGMIVYREAYIILIR